MRRRAFVSILPMLALAAVEATSLAGAQAPPPRLIADNRTQYEANIYTWNGNTWNFVSRLKARSWQAFPNVAQGSQWRAVIGQTVREHRVNLVYDANSRTHQDVWWIQ